MTAGRAGTGATGGLPGEVGRLLAIATERFADLGFLAPAGTLDLTLTSGSIRGLRLEAPGDAELHLQKLRIDVDGIEDAATLAALTEAAISGPVAASGSGDAGGLVDIVGLLGPGRPSGVIVHASGGDPAWIELRFAQPVAARAIHLVNAPDETARLARGLRVATKSRWRSDTIYRGGAQLRAWKELVTPAKAAAETAGDTDQAGLLTVLDLTVRAEYVRATRQLQAKVADNELRRAFRTAINASLMPARRLEWTDHGPHRTFRWWSDEERVEYVKEAMEVVDALRTLTPNVCLGFGSVLSVVRDRALIPHDDDLDIIIAFEPHEAASIADGLARIEGHLGGYGLAATSTNPSHRHVRRTGRKPVDVFVGLFEGDAVSWFPSARGGLTREIVFPPAMSELLGVPCPIPAQPEVYLERVYGAGWRVPDPLFRHPWNKTDYADIAGAVPPASDAQGEAEITR